MSDGWFVEVMGEEAGPYSLAQMVELVNSKRVLPETNVRLGDDAWSVAMEREELFPNERLKIIEKENNRKRRSPVKMIPVVSTDTLISDEFRVVKTLGMVFARRVYGMNVFKDLLMSLADTFGGRSTTAEDAFEKMEHELRIEISKKAYEKGGHAIVNFRCDHSSIVVSGGKTMLYMTAQGTPVALERLEEGIEVE